MSAKLSLAFLVLTSFAVSPMPVVAQDESPRAEQAAVKKSMGVVAYLLVGRREPILPSIGVPETAEQFQALKRTTIELMRSKALLTRALRDPAIVALPLIRDQIDPVQWLQDHLTFDYPNEADLLRVRLHAHRAEDAKQILNAVVNAFFKEVVEKGINDRNKEEMRLRELCEDRRQQIVRLAKEVLVMKQAAGKDVVDSPEVAQKSAHVKQLEIIADALDARYLQVQLQRHEPPRIQRLDDAIVEIIVTPPASGG